MRLTAINPGFVLGPPLDHRMGPATQILQRLMRGKDPAVPRVGFSIVDVRDIADGLAAAATQAATFTVNSRDEDPDQTPGDGSCCVVVTDTVTDCESEPDCVDVLTASPECLSMLPPAIRDN